MLASRSEPRIVHEIPPTPDRFSPIYVKNHAWDNRFEPDVASAPVLTDDLNPVDIWSDRINHLARKGLHRHFRAGLTW